MNITSEKSDTRFQYLVPVHLNCSGTSVENAEICVAIPHDACPNQETTATKLVPFCDVHQIVPGSLFFPECGLTRISLKTESGVISEEHIASLIQSPVFMLLTPL